MNFFYFTQLMLKLIPVLSGGGISDFIIRLNCFHETQPQEKKSNKTNTNIYLIFHDGCFCVFVFIFNCDKLFDLFFFFFVAEMGFHSLLSEFVETLCALGLLAYIVCLKPIFCLSSATLSKHKAESVSAALSDCSPPPPALHQHFWEE